MGPKDAAKKAGFLGDDSINSNFDQPEVKDRCKSAGVDANDGVGLIDKLPGAEG